MVTRIGATPRATGEAVAARLDDEVSRRVQGGRGRDEGERYSVHRAMTERPRRDNR